jgi:Domain of unknown function (DUF1841)
MIFGQDRAELRGMFARAWHKHDNGLVMTALEAQIAAVIADHPEYVDAVTGPMDREYPVASGTTNPFLHLGLHLGIREQVATDRPAGIASLFDRLAARYGDAHEAEHRIIDCLAETLWESQGNGRAPDEQRYLERVRHL